MATKFETLALPIFTVLVGFISAVGGAYLAGNFQIQGIREQISVEIQKTKLVEIRESQKAFSELAAQYIASVDSCVYLIVGGIKNDNEIREKLSLIQASGSRLTIVGDDDVIKATGDLTTEVHNLLTNQDEATMERLAKARAQWFMIIRNHVKRT